MNAEKVLDSLLAFQGAPYTWRGKGLYLWSPSGLVPHAFGQRVFDCSGLIGQGIKDAGGPDWIATRSAESYRTLLPPASNAWAFGVLRLYGYNGKATHVAFVVRAGYVIEAAGGDSTTTSPEEAMKRRNARVAINRDRRGDFMSAVSLPYTA